MFSEELFHCLKFGLEVPPDKRPRAQTIAYRFLGDSLCWQTEN
jgi:hypothetical protein